ncbi:MAG: fused MFS/spermidine synthase [Anaerolineae bacterium]|nr:fused MFS/spermidine synthase [Anaerolineae bacterium]
MLSRRLLYGAAFVAGMTTLGIEMSITRLIGAILGTADIVWAAVITLVLVYLTLGYVLGGRWADRSPQPVTFFRLLAWTALAAGLVPVVARPLMLRMASAFALANLDLAVLIVVGLSVAILFAVPMILLGCVSPFVVRLAISDTATAGRAAGQVYAVSTLGSLLGTFAPTLVLIPAIGTAWTFGLFALILLAAALLGLYRLSPRRALLHAWMPVLLLILLAAGIRGPVKPAPAGTTLLYEKETAYNYVQVVEVNPGMIVSRQPAGTRLLMLNEGQGVHSVYHPEHLQTGATWDMFLAAPYFNDGVDPATIDRIAIIGLAAGTIAQQYTAVYGPVAIDGIEIDPGIVEAGRRFFGMTMPNLNVIVGDGRYGLAHLPGGYDLIAIDAYRVPYIPWHLTTVEFFTEVREKLAPQGVVMINVGRAASDRRFVDAIAATMLQVYPTVQAIDVPYSFNTLLVGTQTPTTADNLIRNRQALPADAHPLLRDTLTLAAESLAEVVPSTTIFTDERAPVETMINTMILEFILGADNLSQIQG